MLADITGKGGVESWQLKPARQYIPSYTPVSLSYSNNIETVSITIRPVSQACPSVTNTLKTRSVC